MRYVLALLLLTACGTAGEILGTANEKQIEVWWRTTTRCDYGPAWVEYRPANSDVIQVSTAYGECGWSVFDAVLSGLEQHGPTYHPLWVMEPDLWEPTVHAVEALNAATPGAYPEPEARW